MDLQSFSFIGLFTEVQDYFGKAVRNSIDENDTELLHVTLSC